MKEAEAVEQSLGLASGCREGFLGALVADERDTPVREEATRRLQDGDGIRHVVERLEERDQVVSTGELGIGGVDVVERDPVLDVADSRRWVGEQPLVDLRDCTEPIFAEQVLEQRPREGSLGLVQVLAVVGVGHAAAASHRLEHGVDWPNRGDDGACQWRDVVEARDVEQRLVMAFRQPESPRAPVLLRGQQIARRLVLEPFTGVPLVNAGGLCQLGRGQRPLVGESSIKAEPLADVDGEKIERADRIHEEPSHESVASFGGVSDGCHRKTSCRRCDLRSSSVAKARGRVSAMETEQAQSAEAVRAGREQWVPRGIATTDFVVARAEGATLCDADGREYLDFAGGIACQNLGHNPEAVVRAVHEQVDRFLHQCFMVGMYEPYVEVARRLDELWPGDAATKTVLVNSGAEAIENAVKIARSSTKRAAVVVFDRAFHGRTNLTMAMTSKLVYKQGFGPLAPEVYRAPAPYPFHGVSTEDALAGLELLFKQDVDPQSVACVVLETVQGEGGFIPMPTDFVRSLKELCEHHGILYVADEVQSGCGRTGPVWAIEHHGVEPDLIVSGKTLGGGLPLAAVTGSADLMDAPHPGGLGGTFGGNPVSCAAACAVLDAFKEPGFRERADEVGRLVRSRLDEIAVARREIGEVRGLGPMQAIEFREKSGDASKDVTTKAREQGLLLLSCGLDGNVIRLLPPLTATDDELERGLSILERALRPAS